MRTSDVDRLRELPSPLSPVATPLIVTLDPVRAVRRRAFLCAAVYIRCAVFTVAAPALSGVLGLGGSRHTKGATGSVGLLASTQQPLLWASPG